jgi:hypothetical protein
MSARVILFDADGKPLITSTDVAWDGSVTRSVTVKVSAQYYGGNQYEGRDFFASHTCECSYDDRDEASQAAFDAATSDAVEAARQYVANLRALAERKGAGRAA